MDLGTLTFILYTGMIVYAAYKFYNWMHSLTLTFLPLKSSFASIGEVKLHEGNSVIDRKDCE